MGAIEHQLGAAVESTWGTAVTPNRFLEFVSEGLERRQTTTQSNGIRTGRRYGGQGRRITRHDAGGPVSFEVATEGFGFLFEHLLGAVATVEDVPSTVYSHTFTPGTLTGKSLTLQKGVQKTDGTVQAFTYPGAKIVSGDFKIAADGLLMFDAEFDAQQEETATGLAAASYATPTIFSYSEGTVKVGGATKGNVRSVGSLKITNNLLTERFFLGNAGTKDEQTNVPFDSIAGALDVEFQNTSDFYDLFVADTATEIELEFVGPQIAGGHFATLTITVADGRFEGETPKVSGPELVFQNVPFVGLDPAAGDAVTIVYKTLDATP